MMNTNMYPCVWFENQAQEAAQFYCSIFEDSKITASSPMVCTFELMGVKFMGLNGGNTFKPNAAISYFVYCENDDNKIEHLYQKLQEGGQVMMPLGKYEWSSKYAFIQDKFGVCWQLDVDPINNAQKIVPALIFANDKTLLVAEAMQYYLSIFDKSTLLFSMPFPGNAANATDSLLFAQIKINDYLLNATSGGDIQHNFDFTEGNSFIIECSDQSEIDKYWNAFTEEGTESQCGWCKDKYGVSWQIIPQQLKNWMQNPQIANKITTAFMQMKKFEMDILEQIANEK